MERHRRAVRLRSGHAVGSILSLIVLGLVACHSPTMPETGLPITRVAGGYFSDGDASQRHVIRSQAEFDAIWRSMFRSISSEPAPAVDFSQEMVIIARAGLKPNGAYCIAVASAVGTNRKATITVRSGGPPSQALLPTVTHPFDIVRVPRRDEVTFTEQSVIENCGILT
jgi:hypothetical protein